MMRNRLLNRERKMESRKIMKGEVELDQTVDLKKNVVYENNFAEEEKKFKLVFCKE